MSQLILFNKPYQVLSQFTDGEGRQTLADYLQAPGYRAAGRLDFDSEGLLLLTDDGRLQHQIANPAKKMWKTYWVQVEGIPLQPALQALQAGLVLADGPTLPARASIIEPPNPLWPRQPPIRERRNLPTCWLQLSIQEGRNRQVRRMTAAVDHPTLRLVRASIGDWSLQDLQPGEHRQLEISMPRSKARKGLHQSRHRYNPRHD
jgi:23S rRNA pseudouridine2457 synthase